MKYKLIASARLNQVALQFLLEPCGLSKCRREEAEPAAPSLLRLVHCNVGELEQVFCIPAVFRKLTNADAGVDL